jgi:hypothetical protein
MEIEKESVGTAAPAATFKGKIDGPWKKLIENMIFCNGLYGYLLGTLQ